ncbi:MAG: sortase [Anaerolineales bacterium]
MGRKKSPEDLSIRELEALLARKRREARQDRLRRFQRSGRALGQPLAESQIGKDREGEAATPLEVEGEESEVSTGRGNGILNKALLAVEILAVVGLGFILLTSFDVLQDLNAEVSQALGGATPTATPVITAVVLPSGHTPPTAPGGAQPNESEIPENLRPMVQSMGPVDVPTPGPSQARRIHIPALWNSPAPVVQGDGWEQLKKGVGQHIGTANPGQPGNMVLSAHNDIFGELFRHLDQLKPGDEIIIASNTQEFVYKVSGMKIVEPTEVEVMRPTEKPTVTLISCYPYLVDTERIVVFGELVES